MVATELLYLRDAYLREVRRDVSRRVDGARVALDRTVLLPDRRRAAARHRGVQLGGGEAAVTDVGKDGDTVWHTLAEGAPVPAVAHRVDMAVDWDRRHALMRTHTALHILCGVIWNEWGTAVTGGNMEPLSARMDFEFDPLPEGFGPRIEELVNNEIAAARPSRSTSCPARSPSPTMRSSGPRSTSSPSQ